MPIVPSVLLAGTRDLPDVPPFLQYLIGAFLAPMLAWLETLVYRPLLRRCAAHPRILLNQWYGPAAARPRHAGPPLLPAHGLGPSAAPPIHRRRLGLACRWPDPTAPALDPPVRVVVARLLTALAKVQADELISAATGFVTERAAKACGAHRLASAVDREATFRKHDGSPAVLGSNAVSRSGWSSSM